MYRVSESQNISVELYIDVKIVREQYEIEKYINYKFVDTVIRFMACDVLSEFKLVNSFSRYSKMAFRGTTEKYVLGLEFQVCIHFVRRNRTNLKYRSCGECAHNAY